MKQFVFILLILLSLLTTAFAEENPLDSLYKIFPKMTDLKGGDSRWIATGIVDKLYDDYVKLSSIYNHFSEKSEKIWSIERNRNYSVDVNLYFAKHVQRAEVLYKELLQQGKGTYERDVDFGNEGRIFVRPISVKKLESEYNLYFRIQNFIVHLHTFDGFALMDFADFFQRKINNFVMENIDMYLFKNFSFKVSKPGYIESMDDLIVGTDNVSMIKISGTVSDENGNVIPNATVDILGHNAFIKTDSNGHYSITFKTGKGARTSEFIKNFTLTARSGEVVQSEDVRIYKIAMEYSDKKEHLFLKINMDKKTGEIYVPEKKIFNQINDIEIDGNYVKFLRNCSPESGFFKCLQKFQGIARDGEIKGNWIGTGGKGSFGGEILKSVAKEYSLAGGEDCSMQTIEISENNTITNSYSEKFFIDNDHSMIIKCRLKDDFFTQAAAIHLTMKPSDVNVKLYKKTAIMDNNSLKFKSKTYLGLYGMIDEPVDVNIPVSAEETKHFIVLSGGKIQGEEKALEFTGGPLYEGRQPVITVYSFDNGKNVEKPLIGKLISLSGKDVTGPTEQLRGDGKKDIHIKLSISGIKGILKNIEIRNVGKHSYIWNTKPFDVYPAIALFYNDSLINKKNGNINFNIDKDMKIDIFMHKPEYLNNNNINLTFRLQIDNNWYKGEIIN